MRRSASFLILALLVLDCFTSHTQLAFASSVNDADEELEMLVAPKQQRAGGNDDAAGASSSSGYRVQGEVLVGKPGLNIPGGWQAHTRVLLNGGAMSAFVRLDGSFELLDVPSGVHLLEVVHPSYMFEPVRVEVSSKHNGRVRAKRAYFGAAPAAGSQQSSSQQSGLGSSITGDNLAYPLKLQARGAAQFFQRREGVDIRGMLMNPMVLMMGVMLIMAYAMPKMMENMDPEERRQMEENNPMNRAAEMPDLTQMLSAALSGNTNAANARATAPRQR
ncbi:hypothetical protein CAOG_04337 [Capsaspora owczarzaki ATCC 30864]|uniref:ER membrane protein complex subunit 7 beta-sandwich domain-containing protein n=1 Tax=Capsaspora owczarzaki (strain ATCC 30864) TaxID=595528 RepID=A0A0D2WPY2_CAPO3|nr:hypothetical protein CAOG_04337 [Capsaspora owczarzaki ATCC 30864]KJE93570.1 hypothetical protein CAOG_004337 [Capsaspora owczarzaki ATCC 30864]|eukprot:XP_004348165.1 hypothetical protein CAOG_04337 [Capsaspora owczarzaki ATCC 30864]